MKNEITDKNAFRAGFIRSMKSWNSQTEDSIEAEHTFNYNQGSIAAKAHLTGFAVWQSDYADKIGICAEYKDFHGQASFVHPTP